MFSIAYIFLVSALVYGAQRYLPLLKFQPPGAIEGLVLLSVILTFGIVGWGIPGFVNEGLGWNLGPGWLERVARIFGVAGGLYLAVRAAALWLGLFLLGLVVLVVGTIGRYIVLGHF